MKKGNIGISNFICIFALTALALLVVFPILYTVTNSFMSAGEISRYYSPDTPTALHIIPDKISLDAYYQMMLRRPDYLIKFWNSIALTSCIVAGQVVISIFAGYAFAKFKFPGRDAIFFVVIVLMMMPLQVTLTPNYIVLDNMKLIGSYWAIILPAIFSPFGTFLMRQVISTMPDSIIEAAKIDGANQIRLMFNIVLPHSKSGYIALVILCFVDNWNMVEQPLVFLSDKYKYPLSIFLSQVNMQQLDLAFACSILAMLPVALLFVFFEKELVEGIGFSNLK